MYEKLSKNALANMYLGTITGIVIALVVIFLLEILLVIPNHIGIAVILGIALAVVLALNALISPIIRFYRYRYKIDDELHKLEIIQGPYDKICNVAKVNVTTAGGDVTIRFLETEKADKITESLKKKINEIAIEQNKQSNS